MNLFSQIGSRLLLHMNLWRRLEIRPFPDGMSGRKEHLLRWTDALSLWDLIASGPQTRSPSECGAVVPRRGSSYTLNYGDMVQQRVL